MLKHVKERIIHHTFIRHGEFGFLQESQQSEQYKEIVEQGPLLSSHVWKSTIKKQIWSHGSLELLMSLRLIFIWIT